ncbi:hypothetical protein [Lacinutrix sp. Bg11-31]|uniref:hypothetical protein n=1 Tax=Lacinutrix sp. Bg11-31 TaxID=2057808 RepID=UPI000C30D9E5|nr:hypothetical protein [Lacinutrix sp. Bg11-31]AUC80907.1 hypothetical protein CW733_01660 [Lacinutrix sp. Bg11-31]
MKTTFKLLILVILVTISSCNNSKSIDYKYSENPKLLACDFPNGHLLQEAVYSFENDIIRAYNINNKNFTKAYSTFLNERQRGKLNVKNIASEHSLKIAKALKESTNLWTETNGKNSLNNSGPLVDCIANNIKDKDIKATYNALLATNSLKPSLILPLLSSSSRFIQADGSLKSYVALEFFYSQLLNTKLEELNTNFSQAQPDPTKPSVDGVNFKKTPKQAVPTKGAANDPHAGHNHD